MLAISRETVIDIMLLKLSNYNYNKVHFLQVSKTKAECGESLIMRPHAPPAVQQRGRRNPARKMRPQRDSQKGMRPWLNSITDNRISLLKHSHTGCLNTYLVHIN